jgi:hypothetical protein
MRPARPVRRHDRHEVGSRPGHHIERVGLQQSRGIGGVRSLDHQGIGCDRGSNAGHPAPGFLIGAVAGVNERGGTNDRDEGHHNQQVRHKEPAGDTPTVDHLYLSRRIQLRPGRNCVTTNMNATVSWVTTCPMMDITPEDVSSPETVPQRLPDYPKETHHGFSTRRVA